MPVDHNARTSPYIKVRPVPRPRRFLSVRWKILTPIIAVLMGVLMCGAYGVGYALVKKDTPQNEANITASSQQIAQNALDLGRTQRSEVNRIAFTQGVAEAIQNGDGIALQPLVEPLAGLANLDLVIIGNNNGQEILGLQRVIVSGAIDYSAVSGTDLSSIAAVQNVLAGSESASSVLSVERRPMVVTAGQVFQNSQLVGVVVVGTDITRALNDVQGSSDTELALYAGSGNFLGTTFSGGIENPIDANLYIDTLANPQDVTYERVEINGENYQAAYFPFVIGDTPLGVIATYQTDQTTFAGEFGRQILSLFFALIIGVVCIVGYIAIGRPFSKLEKVRDTIDRMAAGEPIRVGMNPHDEIGELGAAVDRFAAAAQVQMRQLQYDVRQQRRQVSHLNAILDSLKDGILVQDMEGRVMTMNSSARDLLGAYGDTDAAAKLRSWSGTLAQVTGDELAPGIYAFRETTEIKVNDRILLVKAAAVESVADKHVGTVITLRDITNDLARQAQRDALIDELAQNVHTSITQHAQSAALEAGTRPQNDALAEFAREISQDARAMQRMITEYRDLTLLQPNELRERQHPINVIDLMIDLVEEWRPAALANNLDLNLSLPDDDELHVLGDERRLFLALGNILDNAIKYSGGRGQVMVQAIPQIEQSRIKFVVVDQGVGITNDDLPHIFTRFFRGHPTYADGTPLDIPGTGQGLYLANKIIEAHGGTIGIISTQNEGTQVSILLPLTADMMMEVPPVAQPDAVHSVWDEPTNSEIAIPIQKRQSQ